MLTVGFCNLKGGVGKTTTCQNLAVALREKGKKIAIIDMDPQSNLTVGFGINLSENQHYLLDFLNGDCGWDEVAITREGIDIIPSTLDLVMLELSSHGMIEKETLLKDGLSKLNSDRYDYVFCDSPPQLGIFTRNVLVASDKLFIPLEGGFFALSGLRLLNQVVALFKERLNPGLEIGGIVMSRHNPSVHMHKEVVEEVSGFFSGVFFESYIRQNVSLVEACSLGVSIFEYAPKSHAADDYRVMADEFITKMM
ncbi:MAG: ParA family protein [Synergistaceae bacterium]|nr:ParA family protein [Synergistaceae bacterium]